MNFAVGVVKLEGTRLYVWARDFQFPAVAADSVIAAFGDLLLHAGAGWPTEDGPYAHLAVQTANLLREAAKGDEFFVPLAAPLSLPLPTAAEAQELCQLYGLIEACCKGHGVSIGDVYGLVNILKAYARSSRAAHWSDEVLEGILLESSAIAPILSIMDREWHVGGDVYDAALAVAYRELARHNAWTLRIPAQRTR